MWHQWHLNDAWVWSSGGVILTSVNWSTGTANCPSVLLSTSATRRRQQTAWVRHGLVTAQHWQYAHKYDDSLTTHFGLLSPSGVDGSTGFVSSSGDGELGRSLSSEKSALSKSGRLRPPLPRARRAHERSEQTKVLSLSVYEHNKIGTAKKI